MAKVSFTMASGEIKTLELALPNDLFKVGFLKVPETEFDYKYGGMITSSIKIGLLRFFKVNKYYFLKNKLQCKYVLIREPATFHFEFIESHKTSNCINDPYFYTIK